MTKNPESYWFTSPIMENNQVDKKVENEMETGYM